VGFVAGCELLTHPDVDDLFPSIDVPVFLVWLEGAG
jgi:hypothetical protein